jgi:tetratricopeptide (TPR) repeat protein
VKLVYGEQARAWHRGTTNSEAYELALQGRELWRRFDRLDVLRGRQLIEKALELDPNFAYAMVILGYSCITEGLTVRAGTPEPLFERAIELGDQALALDDSLGDAHAMLCQAFRYKGEHDRAVAHGEQAVALNPDSADANMFFCGGLLSVGRGAEALERIEVALRLNPFPSDLYLRFLGDALLAVGRIDDAIAVLCRCVANIPGLTNAQIALTLAYMAAGRIDEGKAQAEEVLRFLPDFSSSSNSYVRGHKDLETRRRLTDQLLGAGLPE